MDLIYLCNNGINYAIVLIDVTAEELNTDRTQH